MVTRIKNDTVYVDGKPVDLAVQAPGGAQRLGINSFTLGEANFVGAGGITASTAVTTEETLYTLVLPAKTIGINDTVRVSCIWSCTNNANVKTAKVYLGASQFGGAVALASVAGGEVVRKITNRNAFASQVSTASTALGPVTSGTVGTFTVDTSLASTITVTSQKATAGDSLVLESVLVEVVRGL